MDKTAYSKTTETEYSYIGVKFKPRAFTQLTGLSVELLRDGLLSIEEVDKDFCFDPLDGLSFEDAKTFMIEYVQKLITTQQPNEYVSLFDELYDEPPRLAEVLYQKFNFSPRQCQRNFMKFFGNTPQMVLTILRFHYCLRVITAGQVAPKDMLYLIEFSDQSHFI